MFSRKHQFCQHYIQLLDARRVHFVPNKQIGKLDAHHSTMGSMKEIFLRLVNGSINQNKIFAHFYIFYVEHNNFILIITPIYKSEESCCPYLSSVNPTFQFGTKCTLLASSNWI